LSTGEDISTDSVDIRLNDSTEKADKLKKTDGDAPFPSNWVTALTWDDIHTGDCTMLAPQLYVYADSTIYFASEVATSSSGDLWIIQWIQFYDVQGIPVGEPIGKHDGPRMDDNQDYGFSFWDTIPGVTPTSITQIAKATIQSHC
jgi:hypothetical protein